MSGILLKEYERPLVLDHQAIRFETAHSWNPGRGNDPIQGNGNGGINFPVSNPNVIPDGAGSPGNSSNSNGKAVGKNQNT